MVAMTGPMFGLRELFKGIKYAVSFQMILEKDDAVHFEFNLTPEDVKNPKEWKKFCNGHLGEKSPFYGE